MKKSRTTQPPAAVPEPDEELGDLSFVAFCGCDQARITATSTDAELASLAEQFAAGVLDCGWRLRGDAASIQADLRACRARLRAKRRGHSGV